jgi:hypothetical protein
MIPYSSPACSKWTADYIDHLPTIFAENVPPDRYTAAKVQNYHLQYRSRPFEAVDNVARWIDNPQAPFDVDFAAPLSPFRIANSNACTRFMVERTISRSALPSSLGQERETGEQARQLSSGRFFSSAPQTAARRDIRTLAQDQTG